MYLFVEGSPFDIFYQDSPWGKVFLVLFSPFPKKICAVLFFLLSDLIHRYAGTDFVTSDLVIPSLLGG